MKKTLVISGHPNENSFCAALVDAYVESARSAGADVQVIELGKISFDPVLWHGYKNKQKLEPDLEKAQELITWAEHLVFVYPNWWGTMPALMKGFLDRVLLPGFAFKYRKDSLLWDKLLTGRTAHLIVTMDSPAWYYRWVVRMPGHHEMKKSILGFCGINVVKISSFGPIRRSTEEQREKWLEQVRAWTRE